MNGTSNYDTGVNRTEPCNGRIKISLRDFIIILTIVASFAASTGVTYAKLDNIQESFCAQAIDIRDLKATQTLEHKDYESRLTTVETILEVRVMGP